MRTFALLLYLCSVALAEWTLSPTVLGYVGIIDSEYRLISAMLETERARGNAERILKLTESAAMSRRLLETAKALLSRMSVDDEEGLLRHLRGLAAKSNEVIGRLQSRESNHH